MMNNQRHILSRWSDFNRHCIEECETFGSRSQPFTDDLSACLTTTLESLTPVVCVARRRNTEPPRVLFRREKSFGVAGELTVRIDDIYLPDATQG